MLTLSANEIENIEEFENYDETLADAEFVYVGEFDSDPEANFHHNARVYGAIESGLLHIFNGDDSYAVIRNAEEKSAFEAACAEFDGSAEQMSVTAHWA